MHALIEFWLRRWRRTNPKSTAFDGMQPMTVVTGASEGIGRELATAFAALGNPLLLIARNPDRLDEAARKIGLATGIATHTVAADVSTAAGIAAIDSALAARNAYCDVLINDAAMGLSGPFTDQSKEQVLNLVDLNVRSLTGLMHHHLAGMLVRGRGGIVNVASMGGFLPGPHQAAYYASKAFVLSLTEAVAYEVRGQGVRICAIAPGPVDTGFHADMSAQSARYAAFAKWTSAAYVAKCALRGYRLGQTVIVPGWTARGVSLLVRLIPHPILVPVTGWLLKRRG